MGGDHLDQDIVVYPNGLPLLQTLGALQPTDGEVDVFSLCLVFKTQKFINSSQPSANAELSSGTERFIRNELERALQAQAKGKYGSLLEIFVENGGDAEEFEAPIDLAEIEARVDSIVRALKSENYSIRVAASNEALEIGISPQLALSGQLLNNQNYIEHSGKLPDLEKRIRQLSAEFRELQMSRPVDISPVSGE